MGKRKKSMTLEKRISYFEDQCEHLVVKHQKRILDFAAFKSAAKAKEEILMAELSKSKSYENRLRLRLQSLKDENRLRLRLQSLKEKQREKEIDEANTKAVKAKKKMQALFSVLVALVVVVLVVIFVAVGGVLRGTLVKSASHSYSHGDSVLSMIDVTRSPPSGTQIPIAMMTTSTLIDDYHCYDGIKGMYWHREFGHYGDHNDKCWVVEGIGEIDDGINTTLSSYTHGDVAVSMVDETRAPPPLVRGMAKAPSKRRYGAGAALIIVVGTTVAVAIASCYLL